MPRTKLPCLCVCRRLAHLLSGTAALAIVVGGGFATAGEWPGYRGPGMQGHVDAPELPVRWSETDNVKWKRKIAGRGWSTPVILDNQIWMTTATEDGKVLYAVCVDEITTARPTVKYVQVYDVAEPQEINTLNSYASPSPVIEPGRVYVHFGTYGTACIDTRTKETVWARRDLQLDHKEGPGSSPMLYNDLLIVPCDGMDVQYITALDKRTGKTVWKTQRDHNYADYADDLRKA